MNESITRGLDQALRSLPELKNLQKPNDQFDLEAHLNNIITKSTTKDERFDILSALAKKLQKDGKIVAYGISDRSFCLEISFGVRINFWI